MTGFIKASLLSIRKGTPLLVLGCSKRKGVGCQPFIDIYQGVLWDPVKRAGYPRSNIGAISGLHGYLTPGELIETYEFINREADHWQEHATLPRFRADVRIAGSAHIVAGEVYQAFGLIAEKEFPELKGKITYSPKVPIGLLRLHLRNWLIKNKRDLDARP